VLGIGSYALTVGLAAKVAFDVAVATKLTVDQWTKHRAFCFRSPLGAGAGVAGAPLVVPEAWAALRRVRS
jgi:hypothetical protein